MLKNLEVYVFILLNVCVVTLIFFFIMRALKFDSLYKPSNSTYVGEVKTTNRWFLHTDPNDQFISYYIGAKRKYPRLQGVYIFNFDPEKVDVGGTIFVPSQFKIDEWLEETKVAADYFQLCIDKETFPKNPAGCFIYGKQYPCDFLDLCTSNDYGTRQAIIKNNFVVNEEAVNLSW